MKDVRHTDRIAGRGKLCVVLDRDRIAERFPAVENTDDALKQAVRALSDAPHKLHVFYLRPNMEGLLRAIEACDPAKPAPARKNLIERDRYLNRVAFSNDAALLACVRERQPDLNALATLLAGLGA